MKWTLAQVADWVGGTLEGPPDLSLTRPVTAATRDPQGITFAETEDFLARAEHSGVGAVLLGQGLRATTLPSIRVAKPREAFGLLLLKALKPLPLNQGVHPTAVVHPDADVDPTASVGPYTVIESGVRVGPRCRVFAHVYVGQDCALGQDVTLFPHVVLYQDIKIGNRSIVHSGTVLGGDGFGYSWDGKCHRKVPHVGGIHIGEDTEIGSLTAIDRGTAGETRLGDDVKVDNLIQVAHNCSVGDHSLLVAQTGLSGSCTLGKGVVVAGQAGVSQGITLGDGVRVAGRSGVDRDLIEPGDYFGTPARPAREAMRAFFLQPRLPEIFQRLKAVEKALEKLGSKE